MFHGTRSVTIEQGGQNKTYRPGMKVTAGEYVAILQVLSANSQSLTLNGAGIATGGSFSLNQLSVGTVGELVVPRGVTALDSLSTNKPIHLNGDLNNFGTIDGIAADGSSTSNMIVAKDINNEKGGIISTDLSDVVSNGANSSGQSLRWQ